MNGMAIYLAGMTGFFGMHLYSSFRCREPGRDIRVNMGHAYRGLYSLLAIGFFALIVWGYTLARPDSAQLWVPPLWTRHIAYALMLPAMILIVAAYAPAGMIARGAKHPMLAAVKVWAFAHLLVNGDLVSVILFASFLAYAVIARIAAKKRGDYGPVAAKAGKGDLIALTVGSALFALILFWAHRYIAGIALVSL